MAEKRSNKKLWINAVTFALGAVLLVYLYIKYRVAPDIAFANLPVETLDGKPVSMTAYKGKGLLVNFWGTWCPSCVAEMPSMQEANAQLDTSRVMIIAISDEAPSTISGFAEKKKYGFLFLHSKKSLQELGISTYPTSYLIDSNGKVILTKVGETDWAEPSMVERLKALGGD
ncbi:MAG TPA: TlpA disulfide reductase family protein [Bacteroidia bacterium]|nr:TlpA disulfide reductase family protein [Bacteroidia bacterium]